ncbi:Mam3 protein [Saccharomycopsis crataegensis]|uniref:Mam3 protein n=1 Tax=Saccharomycopsis crataegensis TaxID=43959 RepID=A0AAV5QIJ6_9ASCO|nr:Mam3 protein [Saccharomycopsis crataegensis]
MPRISLSSSQRRIQSLVLICSVLPKLVIALPTALIDSWNESDRFQSTKNAPVIEQPITSAEWWSAFILSMFLVVLGGIFAGLTLALMGQDEVNLKVIESSGELHERKAARVVLRLLNRSKHWVLVTLLLSNVITNETLPIILHKCTGSGFSAVLSSTVAIVVFGEVIPQSLCARYGLEIGSFFAPFVLGLMYVLYPVAYPTALLLDKALGEDHGTVYKKAGLKTFVTLHQTMGVERLSTDEVTIISSVLDLKEKKVGAIMTPIDDVFTLSSDSVLDEAMVAKIFNNGFSRIPIHIPGQPRNFIGMLLVRILINYDPEDALPVSEFPLATLPETPPDTTCLNILNYFQEGRSHMVVVSAEPGSVEGAIGILTLEDVIEELIGEEIVDESDVFIDIHNAIKRKNPGPLSKKHVTQYFHRLVNDSWKLTNEDNEHLVSLKPEGAINYGSIVQESDLEPHDSQALKHTDSNHIVVTNGEGDTAVLVKRPKAKIQPKNLASNPLGTSKTFVTIKRGTT